MPAGPRPANRKAERRQKDGEEGKIASGAKALDQAMAEACADTLGHFLAVRNEKRVRLNGESQGYDFYPQRRHIEYEFGRIWENEFSRIILADEISPDSCRLWDTQTNEKLDKDRFRRDLGNVIESYTEVARRLGIMKEMPTVIQGGLH